MVAGRLGGAVGDHDVNDAGRPGLSFRAPIVLLLRTAPKDQPPATNRQPPTATNHQLPTADHYSILFL